MCGIFGYVGPREDGLLRRMADVLRHRGPDDEGFHEADPVRMGMRRLSIIDLAGGHQPVSNEDGTVSVVFNGEIYNYVELIDRLKSSGHVFATRSDTECIVHAWEQWGAGCLEHFNGMFAFALHDRRSGMLFLARDRAGQKPLYWTRNCGTFYFASEIKALLRSDRVTARPDPSVIDAYLALRYVPNPRTLFAGIRCLPAAHCMTVRLGGGGTPEPDIRRYWAVRLGAERHKSDAEFREEYDHAFTDAVRLTMRSDVPVGAYLSGGIDSSVTVAAMARLVPQVKTFSIGFDSPVDETHQARALARRLNCDHHEVICGPEHFALLPKAVWHLERPIGDALILAYYRLAQETSRHVKVVLSGEGADELFAGYQFHKVIPLTAAYANLVPGFLNRGVVAPLLRAMPTALLGKLFNYPAALGDKGKHRVADYLAGFADRSLNANYVHLRSLFARPDREAIYTDAFRATATEDWLDQSDGNPDHDAGFRRLAGAGTESGGRAAASLLDRLLRLQFDDWLQDNLLLRQDKNTMAHSLELRCPFLDHRLIELAFRMPDSLKIRRGTDKYVEREWGKKLLPRTNIVRSKNPFYLPVEYFQGRSEIRNLIGATLNPDAVRKRGWFDPAAVSALVGKMETGEFLYVKQVAALVILELWHRVFIDGEPP